MDVHPMLCRAFIHPASGCMDRRWNEWRICLSLHILLSLGWIKLSVPSKQATIRQDAYSIQRSCLRIKLGSLHVNCSPQISPDSPCTQISFARWGDSTRALGPSP
ncbi:hypothetical protein L226DRAFT_323975 [Lentinus tigrinus ALCF2SS1-7]|uniref:Uncharacterized protein n=1 Tax=Lentinus tigrinus ALCF2SS1-6 TaxID=1328759 RepID=A0A5C2SMM1_9APHY|nr:hypothetical protein L227DRAFT_434982 [Lentinus tigrinus ALCF2SS1-6]RPD77500.1 hypothetical protein L226DRAFT_323975 [Lentinus tigrinus ALCF2SS1-7]